MISAGTGICGGFAIAAMAPVIEAEDKDVSYAISVTFLFDMAMILLFPLIGQLLGLTDMAYGLWTGTSVNDTSSVVAAGYAFSETAGDFATMVKLTRTLAIIPTVLIFSLIHTRKKVKESAVNTSSHKKVKFTSLFPWFIIFFVMMSVINSFGLLPITVSTGLKDISRFLMVAALAAIGLNTDLKELRKSGLNPLFFSVIISVIMAVVALVVIYFMGV